MTKENEEISSDDVNIEIKDPLTEVTELLQRTQANFENYRKQTEKRVEEIRKMASKDVILQVLPVLDNFELALKNSEKNEEFMKGIELIYSQLVSVLENNGVKIINTDKNFDPFYHEALMKVDSDLSENKIIEEFQKGYILNDKVIRHSKVKVSSGKKPKCKECK
ncbi:nucleotide exchange factor GrpE [archaeon]|mgnify:CR=1 FL=1|jgi:molecular chaperone GrpE|nr:nucleotide exchange factor GrpE [archaeon]MBT3451231.1 nucleotide exchange factor GrpE [archaeon]MBT6868682.1 nucleotide exchange factor GrpE [archaeon]MBT7193470.1 nucleotide exchange factor GrpE [archaeon]MBT7381061.1 nucleotide exchange factor GrpE [archaeon]